MYSNTYKINALKYDELVSLLSTKITPEFRKLILERLLVINDYSMKSNTEKQFISPGNYFNSDFDIRKPIMINPRKKDVTEIKHPSQDNRHTIYEHVSNHTYKNSENENDLDDILKEVYIENTPKKDPLDVKLEKIKKLHTKLMKRKK